MKFYTSDRGASAVLNDTYMNLLKGAQYFFSKWSFREELNSNPIVKVELFVRWKR